MAGNNRSARPDQHEVEISLFGPGYGESLLIHLGLDFWLTIDSCLFKDSQDPAPIQYLNSIGVDPALAIKLVIASHWHDDHIRGIGSILDAAPNAKFMCSAALRTSEFRQLVSFSKSLMTEESGLKEFKKIMEVLHSRGGGARKESIGPDFILAGQILGKRNGVLPFEIHSLSPSSGALTLAMNEIAALMPNPTESLSVAARTKRRIVAQEPNHVAVVLWLKVGDTSVLFGSDLEETSNPNTGWSVIVDSQVRPDGKAGVFKVPHHGSISSHYQPVWGDMVESNPIAILTPFMKGKILKPTRSEADQIIYYTPNAYITAPVRAKRTRWPDKAVERTVNEIVRDIKEVPRSVGHIRLRRNIPTEPEWDVELFGSACPLQSAHVS